MQRRAKQSLIFSMIFSILRSTDNVATSKRVRVSLFNYAKKHASLLRIEK